MTAANKSLHDFTLQGIDGKPMPTAQFKGRVVLLVACQQGQGPHYRRRAFK